MVSLKRIFSILKKEFIQLKRDRSTLGMIVMIPIFQLILFGYAINTDPKNLQTVVISRDNSQISRSIITGLKNSKYFEIVGEAISDKDGKSMLQKGTAQFVVTIPENFSKDVIRGNKPSILIEADATDPVATSGALSAIDGIYKNAVNKEIKGALSYLKTQPPIFDIQIQKLYNPEGFTKYNIIPGMIGVILTMTGIMMTALALTRERERGTMENLLAMPVKPVEVMIGKLAPYVLIGYIQSAIILITAFTLFNVPILGSVFLLSLVLLVFIICNLSIGYAISTAAKNQTQAIQMSVMVFLPSIMLSGFLFPFQGMPNWAQAVGGCIPMTYFMRIARGIILKGATFGEIWINLWPLLIFMLVISSITVKIYKKTLD